MAVIDHHEPGDGLGDFSYVNPREAACAMMVFDVLKLWAVEITPDMATCLLTGIVTDTGSFRFPNTSERSMHLAAELIGLGADISKIGEEVYQKRDLAAVKLESAMLDRMQLEVDGRLCWSYLTHEDFQRSGGSDEHTEGLVNDLLSINTVGIAVLFREPRQGKIRCSLRSRREYDVATIAQGFGGGGHRNAAGCTFEEDMESATTKLVSTLKQCLASWS
jgi:phosphoesterase RecJ-like protein